MLSACGGGGSGNAPSGNTPFTPPPPPAASSPASAPPPAASAPSPGGAASSPTPPGATVSTADAARFLTQATFGPTEEEEQHLTAIGYAAWIDEQMRLQPTHLAPAIDTFACRHLDSRTQKPYKDGTDDVLGFQRLWWNQAVTSQDQLRQRVAYAWSQILVVSLEDDHTRTNAVGVGSYYDVLVDQGLGNFRQLLSQAALHPMMGYYLTWINNHKETLDTSGNVIREPDENFAREVMQLFTIGLHQLNPDGTPKLDAHGQPIPSYTHDDIAGIAKVLTGWDLGPASPPDRQVLFPKTADVTALPMVPAHPENHSTSEKRFLGHVIAASGTATAASMTWEFNTLIDVLFQHPNVGPFISRQLIQRLVTSNPSPAYVSRVAAVFNDDGHGVRGNLAAVVREILLAPEARDAAIAKRVGYGKLREPLVRWANFLRAFHVHAPDVWNYVPDRAFGSPLDRLAMNAMDSPSVFNFYRPDYTPPGSALAANSLVAPEMQLVDAQSVVGYLNFTLDAVQHPYNGLVPDFSRELALSEDAQLDHLMDRLDLLLMEGRMSTALRSGVENAVKSISLPDPAGTDAGHSERLSRVWAAVYLLMASPEFVVQK